MVWMAQAAKVKVDSCGRLQLLATDQVAASAVSSDSRSRFKCSKVTGQVLTEAAYPYQVHLLLLKVALRRRPGPKEIAGGLAQATVRLHGLRRRFQPKGGVDTLAASGVIGNLVCAVFPTVAEPAFNPAPMWRPPGIPNREARASVTSANSASATSAIPHPSLRPANCRPASI